MAKRYGHLKQFYSPFGQDAGGAPGNYVKGYPHSGPVEPNVAAQWVFDEASGSIVDEVAGLTLAPGGTQTYSVAGGSGLYSDITPGISCLSNNSYFDNAADTSLAIGTSDFVLEIWFKATALINGAGFFSTTKGSGIEDGFGLYYGTGNKIATWLKSTDNTGGGNLVGASVTISTPSNLADGQLHKIRAKYVRSGNATIIVDGTEAGSFDISSLSGKTVAAYHAGVNCFYPNGAGLSENTATYYSVRLTIGNSTNNSGGPNGG